MNAFSPRSVLGLLNPIALALLPAMNMHAAEKILFDFQSCTNTATWEIVNDDVMGGVSRGGLHLTNGVAVFQGEVSLDIALVADDPELSGTHSYLRSTVHAVGIAVALSILGLGPNIGCRPRRAKHAQSLGGFCHVQTNEIPQFDQFRRDRVAPGQGLQSVVHSQQLFVW